MTDHPSLIAARASGYISHSRSCLTSGSKTCICNFEGRLQRLADRFEAYHRERAEQERSEPR